MRSFLQDYLDSLSHIFSSIHGHELEGTLHRRSPIFLCGNGGSAAAVAHFACDLNKGVSFGKEEKFRVISLTDNIPLLLAYGNDVSFAQVFVEQLKNFLQKELRQKLK